LALDATFWLKKHPFWLKEHLFIFPLLFYIQLAFYLGSSNWCQNRFLFDHRVVSTTPNCLFFKKNPFQQTQTIFFSKTTHFKNSTKLNKTQQNPTIMMTPSIKRFLRSSAFIRLEKCVERFAVVNKDHYGYHGCALMGKQSSEVRRVGKTTLDTFFALTAPQQDNFVLQLDMHIRVLEATKQQADVDKSRPVSKPTASDVFDLLMTGLNGHSDMPTLLRNQIRNEKETAKHIQKRELVKREVQEAKTNLENVLCGLRDGQIIW